MCGIAGILTENPELDLPHALRQMRDALRHRGPDDEGWQELNLPGGLRLGLAHTRLSIIDVTCAGHQPMHDPASDSWIAYNGEVYNHHQIRRQLKATEFQSRSDTETILKGWAQFGEDLLPLMRGMFGLALYDGRRRLLWLVRDRLGIKPLYAVRPSPETWVFASELRALLASGLVARELNDKAVESYLAYGAVAAPWTMIRGAQSLRPGEYWRFDLKHPTSALEPQRRIYWRPSFVSRDQPQPTYEEAVERIRPALFEAVNLRMLADVPVGVFLSGGIDSSALVSILTSQGHALRTFSVVFGESRYDESRHARQVAQQFGTEHEEILLRPTRLLGEFEEAIGAYDQPSIDGVNTYFIAQATRRAGVKVALSGLGGDELFAGYSYFRLAGRLERRLPRILAKLAHVAMCRLAPQSARTTKLGAVLHDSHSRLARYGVYRSVMDPHRRAAVRGNCGEALPLPPALIDELETAAASLDAVNAHSLFELSLYMANMLLRDTDQMSMAHALEVRDPLVDFALVEVLSQIPGSLKLARGRARSAKALLVDALRVPLPSQVLHRPKMGFVLPWELWLRGNLRGLVEDVLTDREVVVAAGLRPGAVAQLWLDYLAGRPGVRYADILCLLHLLHWVRQHRMSVPCRTESGAETDHERLDSSYP